MPKKSVVTRLFGVFCFFGESRRCPAPKARALPTAPHLVIKFCYINIIRKCFVRPLASHSRVASPIIGLRHSLLWLLHFAKTSHRDVFSRSPKARALPVVTKPLPTRQSRLPIGKLLPLLFSRLIRHGRCSKTSPAAPSVENIVACGAVDRTARSLFSSLSCSLYHPQGAVALQASR